MSRDKRRWECTDTADRTTCCGETWGGVRNPPLRYTSSLIMFTEGSKGMFSSNSKPPTETLKPKDRHPFCYYCLILSQCGRDTGKLHTDMRVGIETKAACVLLPSTGWGFGYSHALAAMAKEDTRITPWHCLLLAVGGVRDHNIIFQAGRNTLVEHAWGRRPLNRREH